MVNSAFAASLTATRTTGPIRPWPLAAPSSASKSKEALLAKAQAIQAGSLFDQTMRADTTPKSTSKGKATETTTAASAAPSEATTAATSNAVRHQTESVAGNVPPEMQPGRNKRRRMSKVVFGLAIHSSLNRLDEEEEGNDERRRRNRILYIQSTIERLRSSDPTWRYLDSPRDFLVTMSSAAEAASTR